jgi:hypothetical protein
VTEFDRLAALARTGDIAALQPLKAEGERLIEQVRQPADARR